MNGGRILEFLWMLAFCFLIISVFVFPVTLAYWRHNERLRAEQTEKTLESLGYDTTHEHEMDGFQ